MGSRSIFAKQRESSRNTGELRSETLQLPHAPETGQNDSAGSHSHGDLDGRGTVTTVCSTTLEAAGIRNSEEAASQRLPTQVVVQAAAGV